MSEMLLSFLIAVGILAALFAVVPMLHVCNSGCQRFFGRQKTAECMEKAGPKKAETRPLRGGLGDAA